MRATRQQVWIRAGVAVAVLWLILFVSGHGVLVWSSGPDGKVGLKRCHYFTGTGVVERKRLSLGDDACPRWISLQ